MKTHIYLVTVTLEVYNGCSSTKLIKHQHVFSSKIIAQEKADFYRNKYASSPDRVYYIEVKFLALED